MMFERLGRYEIRGHLGKGAMGTVLDGWDPVMERRVAIKMVEISAGPDADAAENLARLRREAQAAGRLIHPNIAAIHDFGETAKAAFIVMEFVDGRTLKDLIDKKENIGLPTLVGIMEDILAGLQYSHGRGVTHRDIKPGNVMLTADGHAKIVDFGLARLENSNMTRTGIMLGSAGYMSPEQFHGRGVDFRTDIYAAGVLLYRLLTGTLPFRGTDPEIMLQVFRDPPPPPSGRFEACPVAFDAVVARAMAKRKEDRFQSADEFAAAIRAALAPPPDPFIPARDEPDPLAVDPAAIPDPTPPPVPQRPPPTLRPVTPRRRRLAILIVAMLVAAFGGGAYFGLGRGGTTASAIKPPETSDAGGVASVTPPPPHVAMLTPPPAATPSVLAVPSGIIRDCPDCPELVRIPAGSFSMGVPAGEEEREGLPDNFKGRSVPVHPVTISQPFLLGRTHVTRRQYAVFARATHRAGGGCWTWDGKAYTPSDARSWESPGFAQTDDDPAVCLSFDDAQAYVAWLSARTGQKYRLPSEAEWEYAARANTSMSRYWGDTADGQCANANGADQSSKAKVPGAANWTVASCDDGFPYTSPAGHFRPNLFGVYDMLGNAFQWTSDCWNATYAGAPANGSSWGAGDCASRVVRGGSWISVPGSLRAGYRVRDGSGFRSDYVGVRVARTLTP